MLRQSLRLSVNPASPDSTGSQYFGKCRRAYVENYFWSIFVAYGINSRGLIKFVLKGTVTTILLLSCQNCGEIMTQNLCSKQETLLQPQEEEIKRFSKGEQTSVIFSEIFPTQNDKT